MRAVHPQWENSWMHDRHRPLDAEAIAVLKSAAEKRLNQAAEQETLPFLADVLLVRFCKSFGV